MATVPLLTLVCSLKQFLILVITSVFILPPQKYGAMQPDVIFLGCLITAGHETRGIQYIHMAYT